MPRHFLSLLDFTTEELVQLLDRSAELRRLRGTPAHPRPLAGKSVSVIFEKHSTRTRVSFEVGIVELGGHPVILSARDSQIGRGEPIADTARVLGRYTHAIVARTYAHDTLLELAKWSGVPVVNALSDLSHPVQILADLLAIRDRLGRLDGLRIAWIGDGNNVAYSYIEAAMRLPFELVLACPEGFDPDAKLLAAARAGGARVSVVRDPVEAARGAHVLTTDVWASMGQEAEAAARARSFEGFLVDDRLLAHAAPEAIVLHCLPAHRGQEISAEAIDGPRSAVWDQAENRLHTQKAVLEALFA